MEKLVLLRHLHSCADAMKAFCNRKTAQVAEAAAQDITAMRATLSAKQNALTGQPGQVVGFGADGKPEAQDPLGFIKETMAKASLMHALTFGLPITYYVTKSGNWGDTPYPPKASILKEGTVTAAVSGSGTAAFFTLNTGSGFSMVNGAQYLYLCPPLGLAFTNLNWCGNLYGQFTSTGTKYYGQSAAKKGAIVFNFPTTISGQIFSLHSGTDRPKFKVELL